MDKKAIRKQIYKHRRSMNELDYMNKSKIIHDSLITSSFFHPCTIGIYASINHEVETISLIEYCLNQGFVVCLPKVYGNRVMKFYQINSMDDLEEGYMHILEPKGDIEVNNLDMMITPLVAFDECRNRLGYGGGYYDTYFENFKGLKVGLAFEYQKQEFEVGEFDIPLDIIITEIKHYK